MQFQNIPLHVYTRKLVPLPLFTHALDLVAEPAVTLIPPSISPNAITIAGSLPFFVAQVTFLYCVLAHGVNQLQPYHHLLIAAGMLWHMWLDTMDGLHARKTKQTSLMGEWLDFSCDNLTCISMSLTYLLGTQFEVTPFGFVLVFAVFCCGGYSTWFALWVDGYETYDYSVDLGRVWLSLVAFMTYLFGNNFWQTEFLLPFLEISLQYKHLILIISLFWIPGPLLGIITRASKSRAYECMYMTLAMTVPVTCGLLDFGDEEWWTQGIIWYTVSSVFITSTVLNFMLIEIKCMHKRLFRHPLYRLALLSFVMFRFYYRLGVAVTGVGFVVTWVYLTHHIAIASEQKKKMQKAN